MKRVITAGDTFRFVRDLPDYPAPAWMLTYSMVMEGRQVSFAATDNGDGKHLVDENTSAWLPGTYAYQERVTNGTDTHTAGTGTIEVKPDFSSSTGEDARPYVKKVLDALEATILGKATKDQLSYSIANRSISKMSMEEILEAYDYFKREYQRLLAEECADQGMATGRKIYTRMP